jgi:ATP-dependent protease Clp ATPase subunit
MKMVTGPARKGNITAIRPQHKVFAFRTHILITRNYSRLRKAYTRHSNRTIHTMARKSPNIILTGTPGVGKTTHAEQLARATGLKHVSVNQIVKDEGFHEGKDEETGSWIVDEDKVTCLSAPFNSTHSNAFCFYSS